LVIAIQAPPDPCLGIVRGLLGDPVKVIIALMNHPRSEMQYLTQPREMTLVEQAPQPL
jgi:hypothetical protein